MGNSAIGRGTAVEDFKVKASSADATPGFLDGKVDGVTMNVVADQLVSSGGLKFVSVTAVASINSGDIVIAPNKKYHVVFDFVKATNQDLQIAFNSTVGAASYAYSQRRLSFDNPPVEGNLGSDSSTHIFLVNNVADANHVQGIFTIDTFKKNTDSAFVSGEGTAFLSTISKFTRFQFGGVFLADTTITDFEMLTPGGTLTGNIYLYEYQLA